MDKNIKKIKEFVENNSLSFDEGSGFNSTCCILSGYALSLGIEDSNDIIEGVNNARIKSLDYSQKAELERVFEYAEKNTYGYNWTHGMYKKQYTY